MGPLLRTLREANEVGDGLRSLGVEKFNGEVAKCRFEMCVNCHGGLFYGHLPPNGSDAAIDGARRPRQ
jgi:hypothetical protein